jgi:exopolysaccharide biosynthesis polyprenyl glycosylphosphotransferase
MKKHISRIKIVLLLGDIILIVFSIYLCLAIRTKILDQFYVDASSMPFFAVASVIYSLIYIFIFYITDIYNFKDKLSSIQFAIRLTIAIIIANSIVAAGVYVLGLWSYSRLVILTNSFFVFSFMFLLRFLYEKIFQSNNVPHRILVIGAGYTGRALYNIIEGNKNFKIVGYLDDDKKKRGATIGSSPVIGATNLLSSIVKEKSVDQVIIAITHGTTPELFRMIMNEKFNGVEILDMPAFYENITDKIPIYHISDRWLGYSDFSGIRKNIYNTKIKGVLDKIIAMVGAVTSFPLMLVVIIAIKIDSKGTVLFKQERVGENEKIFIALKLRTMDCGKEDERALAGYKKDPRITKVGKIIRFFRIDEIPQLWNVIMGDMSIIGPRLLIKEEVREFTEKVPYFYLRHSVKPGITGWAQVHYKHGKKIKDATEKLQYDLFYIKNLSPVLDLHILLKTVKVVLFGRGAR